MNQKLAQLGAWMPRAQPQGGSKLEQLGAWRPSRRGGTRYSPEVPRNEQGVTETERARLNTIGPNPEANARWLQERGYDAQVNSSGDVVMRKSPEEPYRKIEHEGSWWNPLSWEIRDLTTDAADDYASMWAMGKAGTAAAVAALPAGPIASGAASIGAAGLASAGVEEARLGAAKLAGFDVSLKDAAVQGLAAGIGGAVGQGAGMAVSGAAKALSRRLGPALGRWSRAGTTFTRGEIRALPADRLADAAAEAGVGGKIHTPAMGKLTGQPAVGDPIDEAIEVLRTGRYTPKVPDEATARALVEPALFAKQGGAKRLDADTAKRAGDWIDRQSPGRFVDDVYQGENPNPESFKADVFTEKNYGNVRKFDATYGRPEGIGEIPSAEFLKRPTEELKTYAKTNPEQFEKWLQGDPMHRLSEQSRAQGIGRAAEALRAQPEPGGTPFAVRGRQTVEASLKKAREALRTHESLEPNKRSAPEVWSRWSERHSKLLEDVANREAKVENYLGRMREAQVEHFLGTETRAEAHRLKNLPPELRIERDVESGRLGKGPLSRYAEEYQPGKTREVETPQATRIKDVENKTRKVLDRSFPPYTDDSYNWRTIKLPNTQRLESKSQGVLDLSERGIGTKVARKLAGIGRPGQQSYLSKYGKVMQAPFAVTGRLSRAALAIAHLPGGKGIEKVVTHPLHMLSAVTYGPSFIRGAAGVALVGKAMEVLGKFIESGGGGNPRLAAFAKKVLNARSEKAFQAGMRVLLRNATFRQMVE